MSSTESRVFNCALRLFDFCAAIGEGMAQTIAIIASKLMRRFGFFLALMTLTLSVHAEIYTTAALDIIAQARAECEGFENGQFEVSDTAIVKLDITSNGSPDEMVDSTAFSCSSALTLWGGTGGNYLWAVINDSAYEFLAHQWKVVDFNNLNVLLLAVHPYQCGDRIAPCVQALVWDEGFRSLEQ